MPRGGRRGRFRPSPRNVHDNDLQNHPPPTARWSVQVPTRWRRRPSRHWFFERASPDGSVSRHWVGYREPYQNDPVDQDQPDSSDICYICGDLIRNHINAPNVHLCDNGTGLHDDDEASSSDGAGRREFPRMDFADMDHQQWNKDMAYRPPPRSFRQGQRHHHQPRHRNESLGLDGNNSSSDGQHIGDLQERLHVARDSLVAMRQEMNELCAQLDDLGNNMQDGSEEHTEEDTEEVTETLVSDFEKSLESHYRAFLDRVKQQVRDKNSRLMKESRQVRREKDSIQSGMQEVALRSCDLDLQEKELQEMRQKVEAERMKMMKENDEERVEIRRQWQKLQDETHRMEDLHKLQQGRVKLDVGGHLFTTSISTLTRDPESMLSAMFSGRYQLNHEQDGSVFIDRDGTHFRYILNFLRDGVTEGSLPEDRQTLRELLNEAIYYQVTGLIEAIEQKLDQ